MRLLVLLLVPLLVLLLMQLPLVQLLVLLLLIPLVIRCGRGCGGFDLCVQPGTAKAALLQYIGYFKPPPANTAWLANYVRC